MKAAVLHKAHDLRIEEIPRPVPGPEDVVVRIKAVGVCGSDMHFYDEGHIGDKVVERPFVLGHEASGEVAEVGSAVTKFKPGDRVAVEPGIPCRQCEFCKRGDYNLCPYGLYQSGPHTNGFFAEYGIAPADYIYPLPDNLDFIEGAMLEPLVVGLQGAWEGNVQVGQTVAILGSGPIGLYTLQAVRARGAAKTIVADIVEKRLKLASEMGATHVVNASKVDTKEDILRLTGGQGADVVLETAGAVPTTQQSLYVAKRGGTVVLVGMSSQSIIPMDTMRIVRQRLTVKGCFRYANQYATAVALAAAGKVELRAPVSHTFSLDQTLEALEFSIHHKEEAIKVVITI
ncbi:MAG: NAD(P)-dependent alcohol dehydrogenase [Dehalococcoidales bacterium]|nr:NAD(P)-dependent alcohol dehydrogenase [Dehalococcoidales bacterium]